MMATPVPPGNAKDTPIVGNTPCKCNGRRGFTLGELMLVIGAVAVLLAVLIAGIRPLNIARFVQAEQDIQAIISAGTAYRAQRPAPTHESISFTALKNLALLPPGVSENNPWENTYGVSGTARALTITTDSAHAGRCETLQRRLARRAVWAACVSSTLIVPF